jgi:IS605 OrfB family transposase
MHTMVNKSYSFYSDGLNRNKYNLLHTKALDIRNFKNKISNIVNNDPIKYFNLSKYNWVNEFRCDIYSCNNQDISNAIKDVYVAYNNKIDTFNKKIKSKIQNGSKIIYYKKNTKNNKKDDVKSHELTFKETKLTKVISYLTKYYDNNFINYLENNYSDNKLREDSLLYIIKYGSRLINLVKLKQENVIRKITKHSIEFKSLSFRSCTEQKINIINPNKNKESIFNCVISLSGQNTDDGKIHIPVKYSRKHHGNLKDYYKEPCIKSNGQQQRQISYEIQFNKKNEIRIVLAKLSKDETVRYKRNYYGIDVNVKHNLFADKYENNINYDRKLFSDYIKFLKELDTKKEKRDKQNKLLGIKSGIKLSNKDVIRYNKWKTRVKDMLKRKCNTLVKQCISLGYNHIVMEDLQHMGKSFSKNDEFDGFKYSRLIRLLNLTDLKNIIKSIANKYNIQVTFIQPHYTSKGCDNCGHIDDNNRKIQEKFECVSCGHKANADTHSAKMIEDRLLVDVLRESLLDFKDGLYTPKKLKKETIKNILTECYDTNNRLINLNS